MFTCYCGRHCMEQSTAFGRPHCTSLTVVLTRYIWHPYKAYQSLRFQKIKNCITILPHHDDFRHHHRITSSMANTIATLGPLQLPSSQHRLWPSCCLVRSDSPYFMRNRTISMVRILLHGSHCDEQEGRWQFRTCVCFQWLSPHSLQ